MDKSGKDRMDKSDRIKELVEILNKAGKAYYSGEGEIMSNLEYDALYDELVLLEKDTGEVLPGSPTVNVGYEAQGVLPKVRHESPMLSLDKTKDVDTLSAFAGERQCLLSWKLDGLTVVLTYENGKLSRAVTRGNGIVGELITDNARTFKNIPADISYKGSLTIRGEALIRYSDFERLNREIKDANSKYKNPRNLCSGSVRQLDSRVTAKRNVRFVAFSLVKADGIDFKNSMDNQLSWLESLGFEAVERRKVSGSLVRENVEYFAEKIKTYDYPSDGLVLMYDDIEYGRSLGSTAKFPRNGIAFKWADEEAVTKLLNIEWSPSRTGLINPVAVFEPVELEGTTVSRASVHNLSIVEDMKLGIGDEIKVYKANMIIPQIAENLTKSGTCAAPLTCPACGEKTSIKDDNGIRTVVCENSKCPAKNIKSYTLFVSRNAFNIVGLSEETLEKLVDMGFVREFADIFKLERYKDEIINMPGFGEKSYENLMESIDQARSVELSSLIYALGIPMIGPANAKAICKDFDYDLSKMRDADEERLAEVDGVGEKMAKKFCEYFRDEEKKRRLDNLLKEVEINIPKDLENEQTMSGLQFVITGSVKHFDNRDMVKKYIEERGGKVTGSVTSKTDYLINNNAASASSKNKKAKELGVKIITEDEFLGMWE